MAHRVAMALSGPHLQDFGARDPYEGEIRSNFADKVLGNADTSHIIRRATGSCVSRGWRYQPC